MSDTIATAMLPTKTLVDALKKFQDIPRGFRRLNDMIAVTVGDDKIVLFSTDLETALRDHDSGATIKELAFGELEGRG